MDVKEHEVQLIPMNVDKIRTSFREPLSIQFYVKNIGYETLPALDIHFSPPNVNGRIYFHDAYSSINSSIEPGNWEMITVNFLHGGAPFSDIPNEIPFKVFDFKTRQQIFCAQSEFPLSSEWFTKRFIDYRTPNEEIAPSLNILLFGIPGAGKSSFINSILTSLLPHKCELAYVNDSHAARGIRCFPISKNVDELGNCRINLWDTWGLDESKFRCEFLSQILRGNIPSGFQSIETNNGRNITCSPPNADQITRRIHGVFLFLPIGILEDSNWMNRSNILLDEINSDYGINADIVITRADTIENTLAHKTKIARKFNIAENRVHLVENYFGSTQKNFLNDKVILNIFNNILDKCEHFLYHSGTA